MKKLFALTLMLLCLLAGTALAYPSLEDIGQYARVNNPNPADRLHLRNGPGSGYASLGKYYNGTVCEILKGTASDKWIKVQIYPTGVTGWMNTDYLAFGDNRDQVKNVQPSARVINPTGLNLRLAPNANGRIVYTLQKGEGVTVLGVAGSQWAHVQVENLTGYVMTRYLDLFQSPSGSDSNANDQTGAAWVKNPEAWQRLNLRARPDKDSAILGRYYDDTRVTVLANAGDWAYVRVGGRTGYMMTEYLSFTPPEASGNIEQPAIAQLIITNPVRSQRLNLRKGPGQTYASLGLYHTGVTVEVLDYVENGYAKVRLGHQTGYMDLDYLTSQSVAPYAPTLTVANPIPSHKLNLRAEPTTNSASLGRYGNGVKVSVLGYVSGDEWAYVRVDGQTGYMMMAYLN